MAQMDEVKEKLNTLRVALSLLVGILLMVGAGLIQRYDNSKIDELFWIGVILEFSLIATILLVMVKIAQKTKEIREL
jgi:Na+/melibiose symporter-like transporter